MITSVRIVIQRDCVPWQQSEVPSVLLRVSHGQLWSFYEWHNCFNKERKARPHWAFPPFESKTVRGQASTWNRFWRDFLEVWGVPRQTSKKSASEGFRMEISTPRRSLLGSWCRTYDLDAYLPSIAWGSFGGNPPYSAPLVGKVKAG